MNAARTHHRFPILASVAVLTLLISGCDSKSKDSTADQLFAQDIEDFDYDALDAQIIEASDPEPSLGFALPPNGRIYARTGAIGSTRGAEFDLSCDDGKVLAGITGNFSNRIDKVSGVCVSANAAGIWTDNPTPMQSSAGNNNGAAFSRICPSNHAVIGYTGDFANDYPAYLEVHCRVLDGKLSTTGERISLEKVGTLGSTAPSSRIQCADRAAATGLYGHAGSAIERLGLACYEDPAFAGRWSSRIDWPHIAIQIRFAVQPLCCPRTGTF